MGTTENRRTSCPNAWDKARQKLNEEILSGLEHGFFELTISCELIGDRKRSLTIKAGKSHRFVLAENDFEK